MTRIQSLGLVALVSACDVGAAQHQDPPAEHAVEIHAISGSLHFPGRGPLYVFVADEDAFETPMSGLQHMVLHPTDNELTDGAVGYRFERLPTGTYAIRCFQDENGNGKLDLTGPAEPWGMSFREGKAKGLHPPTFDEVSFDVRSDVSGLDITLD